MAEVWKKVIFAPTYEVSSAGRVRRRGRILKPATCRSGYKRYAIHGRRWMAHRLVLMAFNRLPKQKEQVNHLNGKKDDNRLENLQWVTMSENMQHAIKTGLRIPLRGSKHSLAKLNDGDVYVIRELACLTSSAMLAKTFGVSLGMVRNIINFTNWRG